MLGNAEDGLTQGLVVKVLALSAILAVVAALTLFTATTILSSLRSLVCTVNILIILNMSFWRCNNLLFIVSLLLGIAVAYDATVPSILSTYCASDYCVYNAPYSITACPAGILCA